MLLLQSILFLNIIILINCSTNDIEVTTNDIEVATIDIEVTTNAIEVTTNDIEVTTNDIEVTTNEPIAYTKYLKHLKLETELKKNENQLKIDREKLEEEKKITKFINNIDVIQLNVGGEIIITTRQTLAKIPKSTLSLMFNGRWEQKLQIDQNGNIFFDFNPIIFRHLLYQLQILDTNTQINFYPPSQSSLVEPFKKMLQKLGLNQLSSLEKNNIITFNVGGQFITNRYQTFNQVSNSTFDTIVLPSKTLNFNNQTNVFLDYDPKIFQHLINQLRKESFKYIDYSELSSNEEKTSFDIMLLDLNIFPTTTTTTTTTTKIPLRAPAINNIHSNARWQQNGLTVAGGNGKGNGNNQLSYPWGLYIDDDQTIYIADQSNHRIIEWKWNATSGQVVAGGNEKGNEAYQLSNPVDVTVDKEKDNLIICDNGNRRVVRWPRQNGTSGETIISNIDCWGLTMDENGSLYVIDYKKHEVRRYRRGESQGTVVAGGNGNGNRLDQLSSPTYVFVDRDHSVYVSEYGNHRVMKWMEGAKEGIVVAGGQEKGNSLRQLSDPLGVVVDQLDTVYVADFGNARIMRWMKGATLGNIIVGGNGKGEQSNQLNYPVGLSFDRHGNLYVVDNENHRVQKFNIDRNA